ncbi:MAG: glycerol-3-phosphate 1-O-acyltransferase PlsY [Erysipelotrichaceae bacterium]|nr:glycerol-3-phosphate 1-O-acyltransferase PlsY [Erysipelotrichaceae bacterium]
MLNITNILLIILGYLFGSIPWALVIGKIFYKKDIRNFGSGNLGGTNAGRVLGKKAGVIVSVLDALKSFFIMLICNYISKDVMVYAGLACCIGHCFPIFANFKGGKAVATAMGFYLGISVLLTNNFVYQFLMPVIIFFVTLYISKMVSLSSIIATLSASIISFLINNNITLSIAMFILWIFVTYRHKENIKRIINKTEKKITWM